MRRLLPAGRPGVIARERLRWSGSLAIALGLHATVVAMIIGMTSPATRPTPDVTEIEVSLVDPPPLVPPPKAAPPPEPDRPPGPRPVPPAETAVPPVPPPSAPGPQADANSPAPQAPPALPFHDGGFSITPGSPPTTAADARTAPPSTPDPFALWSPRLPTPPAPQTTPAEPAARLSPLVVTAGARHDPRQPAYPAEARARGEQGDVLIEIELDPSGALRSTRLKKSSGHASLDTAALQSARSLRFRPPRPPPGIVLRHAILVEVPFSFRLE
ncbi:energy transducer TonB [Reyranella sp. CPCC 100927]|uniref:energy transducer TonB n=1 Tax=Reyranella sp. CPCC 100927 TaxID=2599616 RepID=UPI0011B81534|nr:energy transducer TonB [Reyranella sp. CPCC 100927]TWS95842.1 energy transducer TonB [Reyranella sp. CPCC 100927]